MCLLLKAFKRLTINFNLPLHIRLKITECQSYKGPWKESNLINSILQFKSAERRREMFPLKQKIWRENDPKTLVSQTLT